MQAYHHHLQMFFGITCSETLFKRLIYVNGKVFEFHFSDFGFSWTITHQICMNLTEVRFRMATVWKSFTCYEKKINHSKKNIKIVILFYTYFYLWLLIGPKDKNGKYLHLLRMKKFVIQVLFLYSFKIWNLSMHFLTSKWWGGWLIGKINFS